MTGQLPLDWAVVAVSLCNTILLLWLGLTVWLNAERRTRGIWLAAGGLLLGGAFFFGHSALLIQGQAYAPEGIEPWWRMGWIPVLALPLAWYGLVLWYAGYWDQRPRGTNLRHRAGLLLTSLMAFGLGALFLLANPVPSLWQASQPEFAGIILLYPVYSVLCIGLSLDALRRPGPSKRAMGDLARRRAHPWLVTTAVALLVASFLVAWAALWTVGTADQRAPTGAATEFPPTLAWFDLMIAALIGAATFALGQAIVAYEVFTGKTLPRGGLQRYWRNAVILAVGYSLAVGWTLAADVHVVYSLLLTILLIVVFYALLSWRSFAERERYIEHLRPFVASERLFDHLVTASASPPPPVDASTPFRALCEEVLGARGAYLVGLGPLAPLAGPPLAYPDGATIVMPSLSEITAQCRSPQTMCVPLDSSLLGGPASEAAWAVPLWSERGLIGLLLLGEKRDGRPYTQEEIEIARASGERLIDTQASAEMARRLLALQRQRLGQSRVVDQRTRRVLHDEVLPILHAAVLSLDGGSGDARALLTDVHHQLSNLLRAMPPANTSELDQRGLVAALQETIAEEFDGAFDAVTWRVEPTAEQEARAMPPLAAEVLFYAAREAIRNAACHGRSADPIQALHLTLTVARREGLRIVIEDDGVGLAAGAGPSLNANIPHAAWEGPSPSNGQGLALHSTMMAVIGGSLTVESEPGTYTRVTLALPQRVELSP
jgi:signal transduction histidine kinase